MYLGNNVSLHYYKIHIKDQNTVVSTSKHASKQLHSSLRLGDQTCILQSMKLSYITTITVRKVKSEGETLPLANHNTTVLILLQI